MRISKSIINKIITIILIILPILEEYTISGMPGTAADIVMILVVGIFVLDVYFKKKIKVSEISSEFGMFVIFIFINYILSLIFEKIDFNHSIDYIRLALIYLSVIFLMKKYIVYETALFTIKLVGFLNCVYAVVQYIGIVILGIYVPSYLPFLQHRIDLNTEEAFLGYSMYYRPHSIFSEPAHFAEYILLYLFLVMWKKNKTKWDLILEVFITGCLFLTGSSTAIVGAFIIWVMFVIKLIREHKLKVTGMKLLFFTVVGAFAVKIIAESSTLIIFIKRFIEDKSSISGRMENINFYSKMSIYELIFGRGYNYEYMIENVGWLPGYGLIIWNLGIVGVLMYIVGAVRVFLNNKRNVYIALLFIYIILNIGTEISFSYYSLPYLLFIINGCQEEKDVKRYHSCI